MIVGQKQLPLFSCMRYSIGREGSQAWSTALASGVSLEGVLGFKSHPSHSNYSSFFFYCLEYREIHHIKVAIHVDISPIEGSLGLVKIIYKFQIFA